ncbi:GNAT family N-acetyltransferase [Aureibacillus halotolerans]|uniref:Putative GNAT family N-acyltransferase n=1 Tax=Aureibacillus halotolerans TaxID=1508390 RepID=A0A4R6UG89_9BACI|nr:GNAT family N-acetyltransferase [Aureibacillus halotolerans]TDQ42154.1 putative GNAT family N-acyltransferase [Aureibacillus halotolerans]
MIVKWAANDSIRDDAHRVRELVFIEEQNVPRSLEMDAFDAVALHAVCYLEGQAVGAVRFRETTNNVGKVERLCVLSTHRGYGIGKHLMHAIEKLATLNQLSAVQLNAQSHALPFYEKLGYEAVSEPFMEANMPHVTMLKKL